MIQIRSSQIDLERPMFTGLPGQRRISIQTPLGPDALVVNEMEGVERISEPFCFQIKLLSEDATIAR